jgi:hypothetical protein
MFKWQASGRDAHLVMETLRPYLCSPKIVRYEEMKEWGALVETCQVHRRERTPDSETAWAAGFFDGEGCVSEFTTQLQTRKARYLTLIVAQAATEHLERFRMAVGLGNITGPYKGKRAHHKPMYKWQQAGKKAHVVMETLRPFLCSTKLLRYDAIKGEVSQ